MRISSDRVLVETQSYYTVRLSNDYPEAEYDSAVVELKVFRANYYGDDADAPEITLNTDSEGVVSVRFPIEYSLTGTSLNPLVYDDIVDVHSLIK